MKAKLTPRLLLDFLKIPYEEASGGAEALLGSCPVCGKENHCYMNFETGLYYCHVCNAQGNDWVDKLLGYVANAGENLIGQEYWEKRGFSVREQEQYKLGYYAPMQRYAVPYMQGEHVYNITFRHSDPAYQGRDKYLRVPHIYDTHYYLPGADSTLAFIVEGEINAISVKKAYPDATVIGLGGGKVAQESILNMLPRTAQVHALIDADKGPSKKLKALIPGVHIHLMNYDANETLVKDGLETLIGVIQVAMLEEDEGEEGPAVRSISAPDYMKLPDDVGDYMIQDLWVDRSLGFVAGIPKSMKSMLTLHMAHHVAKGTDFLGKKVLHAGIVLLVQEEDGDHIIRKRLSVYDGDTSENLRIWTPGVTGSHIRLDNERGLELLDSEIQRVQPVLVVLDPLANMHTLEDENNAASMNRMLEGLRYIRDLRKTSIMIVHHLRKEGPGEGPSSFGQRMRGSSVLHAKSECALYLERVGTSDLIRVRTESKLGQGRNLDLRFQDGHFRCEFEGGAGVTEEEEAE